MKSIKKLADVLARVGEAAKINKCNIIRSQQILRADREFLVRTKWLQEVIKGWYLLVKPDTALGDSVSWYANFWDFLRIYLEYHFGENYCLSAEDSLDLHTGSLVIPKQIVVISSKGGGVPQGLPFDTSVFIYADPDNLPEEKVLFRGLRIMPLPYALCKVSATYFQKHPKDAEIALRLVRASSELSEVIVKYHFKSAASRLLGAYAFLSDRTMLETLNDDLLMQGWKIKEENPFLLSAPMLTGIKIHSPYVARIYSLWNDFREKVIPCFPPAPGLPKDPQDYLHHIKEIYEKDAYNSLSIEGFQVDDDLIEKVQNRQWNPDLHLEDKEEKNALAARGYYEAFGEVKKSLLRLFNGGNSGQIVEKDLKRWYQSLFSPSVRAGILRQEDLLGYRRGQVYIRNSRHVPLPREALMDAMEALFSCLEKEPHAAVRAVLGHYVFVFIHPYVDGNGRIGRFLMNAMFASGGYCWTIVRVKHRKAYLEALEAASVEGNIEPFARFIADEMKLGDKD